MNTSKVNWFRFAEPKPMSYTKELEVGKYLIQTIETYDKVVGYDEETKQTMIETETKHRIKFLEINEFMNGKVGTIGDAFAYQFKNTKIVKITKLEF